MLHFLNYCSFQRLMTKHAGSPIPSPTPNGILSDSERPTVATTGTFSTMMGGKFDILLFVEVIVAIVEMVGPGD